MPYERTTKWVSAAPFLQALMDTADETLAAGVKPDRLADYLRDMAADLDDLARKRGH